MNVTWSFEQGQIWATCEGGRRIPTWKADPALGRLADLLNANTGLGALLLAPWIDDSARPADPPRCHQNGLA